MVFTTAATKKIMTDVEVIGLRALSFTVTQTHAHTCSHAHWNTLNLSLAPLIADSAITFSVTCSLKTHSGQGGGFSGPKKNAQPKGNLPSVGLTIKIQPLPRKTGGENDEGIVRVNASISGV